MATNYSLDYLRSLPPENLIARTLAAEGGRLPEAAVMANRLGTGRWGDSYADVILAPGQFSAYNALTGYAGGEGANTLWQQEPSPELLAIGQQIVSGEYDDPTGGALNYYAASMDQPPSWASEGEWTQIGDHYFGTAGQGGPLVRNPGDQYPTAQQPDPYTVGRPLDPSWGTEGPMQSSDQEEMTPWGALREAMTRNRESIGGNSIGSVLGILGHGLSLYANAAQGRSTPGIDYSRRFGEILRGETGQNQNATYQYLMDRNPQVAQMYANGEIEAGQALNLVQKGNKGLLSIGQGRLVDPYTGELVVDYGAGETGYDPADELSIVKAYRGNKVINKALQLSGYANRVAASPISNEEATGASDIALVFNYMKLLDPDSVVREGEFATAESAGGVGEQVWGTYNRLLNGDRLTPEVRQQMIDAANKQYSAALSDPTLRRLNQYYKGLAERTGIPLGFLLQLPEEQVRRIEEQAPSTPTEDDGWE